jgi:hypothetical protein
MLATGISDLSFVSGDYRLSHQVSQTAFKNKNTASYPT